MEKSTKGGADDMQRSSTHTASCMAGMALRPSPPCWAFSLGTTAEAREGCRILSPGALDGVLQLTLRAADTAQLHYTGSVC